MEPFEINEQGEFISDSGREYSLLEGMTIGGKYTSDIAFIIDYTDKPSGVLVAWLYGADDPGLMKDVERLVRRYESTGERLI